jgi:hypothetical protein
VGVILLSFWVTLKLFQHLEAPSQTIVCQIPLGPELPQNGQNLPIVIIGETGHADVAFIRNEGAQLVIGLDEWGFDHKEEPIAASRAKNNTMKIVADYTHNVYTISLGSREVLKSSGKIASKFTTENIAIGTNQIGFPNIAPTFPALLRRADGSCKARDTTS